MNNTNQAVMSIKNEQSLYEYLKQQMNDKISLLSELKVGSVIKNPITGQLETQSDDVIIQTTMFHIDWLSKQMLELNISYGKTNEYLKGLVMENYLGNPKKYEVRSEGPSEGDIECIIEGLIEDKELPNEFDTLLQRTLTIFDIK